MNDRRKNDKSIEPTKEKVRTPTIAIVLSNDNITNKKIIRFLFKALCSRNFQNVKLRLDFVEV